MKKQVLAVSAALFLSAICLGAMRAVPAKAVAQETAAVAIGGPAIVYQNQMPELVFCCCSLMNLLSHFHPIIY